MMKGINFLKKYHDDEVTEILARGMKKLTTLEIVDALRDVIPEEKADEVEEYVRRGQYLSEALYNAGVISEDLYTYLVSVERTRTLPQFVIERKRVKDEVNRIKREVLVSLLIPAFVLFFSFVALYVTLYRLYPRFKPLMEAIPPENRNFPFYFQYIDMLSQNKPFFFLLVGTFVLLLYLFIKNIKNIPIPFIKKQVYEYYKLLFYSHLYLSFMAKLTEIEALQRYAGTLKEEVKNIIEDLRAGVSIIDAFVQNLSGKIDKIEKAMIVSAFRGNPEEGFKDLYEDKLFTFQIKLQVIKTVLEVTAIIVVAGIIFFIYGGIFIPIYTSIMDLMR